MHVAAWFTRCLIRTAVRLTADAKVSNLELMFARGMVVSYTLRYAHGGVRNSPHSSDE